MSAADDDITPITADELLECARVLMAVRSNYYSTSRTYMELIEAQRVIVLEARAQHDLDPNAFDDLLDQLTSIN